MGIVIRVWKFLLIIYASSALINMTKTFNVGSRGSMKYMIELWMSKSPSKQILGNIIISMVLTDHLSFESKIFIFVIYVRHGLGAMGKRCISIALFNLYLSNLDVMRRVRCCFRYWVRMQTYSCITRNHPSKV